MSLCYFNVFFTLKDDDNNSIVISPRETQINGDVDKISKLLLDFYFKNFSNDKVENIKVYFNNNLYLDNCVLKSNSTKIDCKFKELAEIFQSKLKVRLLK